MSYELIICEKPSAAKNVANALADGKALKKVDKGVTYYLLTHGKQDIVVVPAVGHLYGLVEEVDNKKWKYPVFDIKWVPSHEMSKGSAYTTKYLNLIKKLSKKASSFVVACDYDIEGEVIGLNIIKYAAKQKDAKRMKFSTQTKPDLIEAYEHASKHLDWPQAEAGETRHKLDWYFGINLSRALTDSIKAAGAFKVMSTGRVQGPALKLLVEKEKEIRAFKPEPFWQIEMLANAKNDFVAMHKEDKFWDKKKADTVMGKVKGQKIANISDIEKKKFNQNPPFPFDLTSLQIEAHRVLHISPKITLSLAQDLYVAGLISYPRTSSQKLPASIGYKKILTALSKQKEYVNSANFLLGKKVIKPSEGTKTDAAHPAIFPTGIAPRAVKPEAKRLYDLIVRRFLAVFGDVAVRETVKLSIDCNTEIFEVKGTTTLEKGWHELYGKYAIFKETLLPALKKGDKVTVKEINLLSKETQPPKHYTESSIIKELEKRDLGTKATRANIIDTLVQRGYVTGKSLEATELGIRITDTLTKYCPLITDEKLTRNFEKEMDLIRDKKSNGKQVLEKAKKVLLEIFEQFTLKKKDIGTELLKANKETQFQVSLIGDCPKCKKGTLHLKKGRFGLFIACSDYPDCKATFSIPRNSLVQPANKTCDECGYPKILIIKRGKQPTDICINPDCPTKKLDGEAGKEAQKIESGEIKKKCPKCGDGKLVLRNSIYGQFYGCNKYPKCRHIEKINSAPKEETKDGVSEAKETAPKEESASKEIKNKSKSEFKAKVKSKTKKSVKK